MARKLCHKCQMEVQTPMEPDMYNSALCTHSVNQVLPWMLQSLKALSNCGFESVQNTNTHTYTQARSDYTAIHSSLTVFHWFTGWLSWSCVSYKDNITTHNKTHLPKLIWNFSLFSLILLRRFCNDKLCFVIYLFFVPHVYFLLCNDCSHKHWDTSVRLRLKWNPSCSTLGVSWILFPLSLLSLWLELKQCCSFH